MELPAELLSAAHPLEARLLLRERLLQSLPKENVYIQLPTHTPTKLLEMHPDPARDEGAAVHG
jgi:hypothetical protein